MDAIGRITLALLVAAALCAPLARADSTPSPEQAVAELNAWRAQVGVDPVVHEPSATEGCRLHAAYYRLNRTVGHFEDPAKPGYTPQGDGAAQTSVLHYGSPTGPKAWEHAVYHRTALLNPRLRSSGYWSEFELGCMSTVEGSNDYFTPVLSSYSWPFDGQQGVATTFRCDETPNPCESVPGNPGTVPTGTIPSVQVNGPWYQFRVHVSGAALLPDGGEPVALTVEDGLAARGGLLSGGAALIPHRPLEANRWYTATVTGTVADLSYVEPGEAEPLTAFTRTWRFRTAAHSKRTRAVPPRVRVTGFRRRGRSLEFRLHGGRAVGRRASYYLTFGRRDWMSSFRERRVRVRRIRTVRIALSQRELASGRAMLHLTVPAFRQGRIRYQEGHAESTVRW